MLGDFFFLKKYKQIIGVCEDVPNHKKCQFVSVGLFKSVAALENTSRGERLS